MQPKESPQNRPASTNSSDGNAEPQVFAISRVGKRWKLTRRELLTGAAASAAVAIGIGSAGRQQASAAPPVLLEDPKFAGAFAHTDAVRALAVGDGGRTLVSGGMDKLVKLWELPTGGHLKTLEGHTAGVGCLAVSPDGLTVASGSQDGQVRLWSLPAGKLLKTIDAQKGSIRGLAFTPDGKALVSGGYDDSTIKIWSLPDGTETRSIKHRCYGGMGLTPDGQTLAVACDDKTVKLVSLSDGSVKKEIGGHKTLLLSLVVSPDGTWLASGSADETIQLASPHDSKVIRSEPAHVGWVNALAASKDGRMLAIGGGDKLVKIWSVPDCKEVRTLAGHSSGVAAVAFTPDGKWLASGGHDKTIRLWNLETGVLAGRLMDVQASTAEAKAIQYRVTVRTERVVIVVPAWVGLPPGAECVCYSVAGKWEPPVVVAPPDPVPADPPNTCGTYCNCVARSDVGAPGGCRSVCPCVGRCLVGVCTCDGACGCDSAGGHYWYPN